MKSEIEALREENAALKESHRRLQEDYDETSRQLWLMELWCSALDAAGIDNCDAFEEASGIYQEWLQESS